jgi:hypothetical protein
MCWDADELLTCTINDIEDGSVAVGCWELFNEVKGDGVPWSWQDRELLDQTEWLVLGVLVPFAGDTTVNEIFDVSMYVQPGVLSSEQVKGLVLARVSYSWVIVLEL